MLFKRMIVAFLLVSLSTNSFAYKQETHKRIVIDAIAYMKANPETTAYNKLVQVANAAGITVEDLADRLGQGAFDVDDFADTFICGAISGDCVQAPLWGLAESIVKYTSYWHFQNHTQGVDAHGNDFGGYNYARLTVWGDVDNMAAAWLHGDHLDDGRGGQKGWFGEDSEYQTYQVTEANYRQGSYSSYRMYKDFETMPFQPLDNLAQYWYSKFWAQPNIQSLGFVMHSTDLLQPHHTWTTSALNHSGWEAWVKDYYDAENLNNFDKVTTALNSFTELDPNNSDIRSLLTEGGAFSYSQGGAVLHSTSHSDRVQVANQVVPHAIAMVVHLLNHSMTRF